MPQKLFSKRAKRNARTTSAMAPTSTPEVAEAPYRCNWRCTPQVPAGLPAQLLSSARSSTCWRNTASALPNSHSDSRLMHSGQGLRHGDNDVDVVLDYGERLHPAIVLARSA